MSLKELVYSQVNMIETPFVPYTLWFENPVIEMLDAHFNSRSWGQRLTNCIERLPSPIEFAGDVAEPFYIDGYGSLWRTDKSVYHLEKPVLPDTKIEGLKFPNLDDLFTESWLLQAEEIIQTKADRFLVAPFGFGLFERSWAIRGFEQVLIDCVLNPVFYENLLDEITEHQLAILERLLKLPVDGIMFSDDWGYQRGVLIGPERWRQFLKPRLRKMYDLVHHAGKVTVSHCCGSVIDIMPDIIEIGLDILQSVQPEAMNPYELKKVYGNRITFWGGLGTQSILQFGTPAQIREEITMLCTEMGRNGGYILAPAKPLQPGIPLENAIATIEAFIACNSYSIAAGKRRQTIREEQNG
jgi:uroporphyrinogen decarboxylase